MGGIYHDKVAKQKTGGSASLERICSAQEKAGSDNATNTVDESMYKKKGGEILDETHLIIAMSVLELTMEGPPGDETGCFNVARPSFVNSLQTRGLLGEYSIIES